MDSQNRKPRHIAACAACGGIRLSPYRKGAFRAADLTPEDFKITDSRYGITWDLSVCLDCGHIFADPCPSPELVNATYGAIEDPLYDAEAAGRGKNFLRILRRLEKLLPAKGRLMDVGAATGILLHLARERGWTPDGVEPSAWAVDHARRTYGISLKQGAFETVPLDAGILRRRDHGRFHRTHRTALRSPGTGGPHSQAGRHPLPGDSGHPQSRRPAGRTPLVALPAGPPGLFLAAQPRCPFQPNGFHPRSS
jgi:hypothetical protein